MGNREVVDGLVSIIMPSWNTERFIAETIHTLVFVWKVIPDMQRQEKILFVQDYQFSLLIL